ncbi:MAG: HAD hydrolase family protein [Chitinivibrionales bacterium]|nr:HAD hydrolase family protein [Chitinivibrionales bacterium]
MSNISSQQVSAIFLDFDGVLTDNRVLVFENGQEAVLCNRSDGLAISMLKKAGIQVMVISTERNAVVKQRCKKIGIDCINSVEDKASEIAKYAKEHNFDLRKCIFVGNDINDIGAMKLVGKAICVSDAYAEVKKISDIVLDTRGGYGAIRELAGMILAGKVKAV